MAEDIWSTLQAGMGAIKGATSDLLGNLDLSGPRQPASAPARDPFAGLQLGGTDPFKGASYGNTALDNLPLGGDPFAALGGRLGGTNPQTGQSALGSFAYSPVFTAFDAASQKVAQKQQRDAADKQQAQINAFGGTVGSGPSSGMEAGVAQWAQQAQQTFGDINGLDPDTMLAIMTNESHGDPNVQNHQGYPAYGLFQLWDQPGLTVDQQFQAARQLAQQKLASIDAAYAAHGLNPDARTRARDFALAWGGHFDYGTGLPDPNSRDKSGQTAQQLGDVFLANYDKIKAGRQQASAPGGGGSTGMAGITPGVGGQIMQEFGVTPTSQGYLAAGNHVYDYGSTYGMAGGGHPGVDWAVPRGTQVATPLSGVVSIVGNDHGTGYYYQDTGNPDRDHSGEFAITLANGDILILGHLSHINAQVGQQINAGTLIGASGGSDGDHVHVEYRQRQADGSYRVIDPRGVLGPPTGGGGTANR